MDADTAAVLVSKRSLLCVFMCVQTHTNTASLLRIFSGLTQSKRPSIASVFVSKLGDSARVNGLSVCNKSTPGGNRKQLT